MSWVFVVLGGHGCNLSVRESALLDVFIAPHPNRYGPKRGIDTILSASPNTGVYSRLCHIRRNTRQP